MTERQRDEEDEGCSAAVGIFIKYTSLYIYAYGVDFNIEVTVVGIFIKYSYHADYVDADDFAFNIEDDAVGIFIKH